MDSGTLPTFLSKHVKCMLVEIGEPYLGYICKNEFITSSFTLSWEKVGSILCISDNFCIHNQPSSWFIDKIGKLWPIFVESHTALKSTSPSTFNTSLYQWTSHPKEIRDYLNLFFSSCVSTVEAILFLTAIVERSLGNVLLIKGCSVPSLLRDLLSKTEMQSIFGQVPIIFLQILMGTPLALNLRNIVWHGFPREDELYPHFVSTLLVTILSFGEILSRRKIDCNSIPKRTMMCFSEDSFSDTFPIIQSYHVEILKLLSVSDFIPVSHFPFWKCAIDLAINGSHGRSLVIMLPQIEHMLRCLFCKINNCSERSQTAESATLYTTLNEIMSENIVNEGGEMKENKLINFLGENILEMLQDIFVHQFGPRVRDKISHGECDFKYIPAQLVNQLMLIVLIIQQKLEESLQTRTEEELRIEELKKIIFTYKCYETKYHQSTLLKHSIVECCSKTVLWSTFLTLELSNKMEKSIDSEGTELCSLIKQVHNFILKNCSFSCSKTLSVFVSSLRVHTVFRHRSENELLNILHKIMRQVDQICDQVMQSLVEKQNLFSQHLLRSRQRDTFQRMLHLVPKLKDILYNVICIVVLCLKSVNSVSRLTPREFEKLTKLCRSILQFVQNVVSLTRSDKNRWMEIEKLAEKHCCEILRNFNVFWFPQDVDKQDLT